MEALAYSELEFDLVLILAALLLLLSVLRSLLDSWLYAGLIGQLALGALLGTPLAGIIPIDIEYAIQVLGYLGLLLLVAQGGMETRLDVLGTPFNLSLAVLVGLTGIAAPIGLSMALLPAAFGYELLESFALGAALASTSLGTIFAVMSAVAPAKVNEDKTAVETSTGDAAQSTKEQTLHGMGSTLVGTVLVGAALLDDIIGLVLSGVVKQLGTLSEGTAPSPWSIAKPVVSSILLILVSALFSRFALGPFARLFARRIARASVSAKQQGAIVKYGKGSATFAFATLLCAFVTISHEIGSTMLLGAFCAGAVMTYVYHEFEVALTAASASTTEHEWTKDSCSTFSPHSAFSIIVPVQTYVLAPFFFCSIGFAIPLRSMFTGVVAWRGFVYAGLMGTAKVLAGLWILPADALLEWRQLKSSRTADTLELRAVEGRGREQDASEKKGVWQRSWKVACLLGMSLVARGEIGFLIINVAREGGILAPDSSSTASEAFNVGTWAIVLNTLAGPIAVGILLSAKGVAEELERGRWGFVGLR